MGRPGDAVAEYLRLVAAHSTGEALACLARDFELEFRGSGFRMTKADLAEALAWDAGANGRLEWDVTGETDDTLTIQGWESNDFLELIGIDKLPFESAYTIDEDGRLIRQMHKVEWGSLTLGEAMAPLISWASDQDPEELNEIYPGGRMVYTRAMAERWVKLAERWRGASDG